MADGLPPLAGICAPSLPVRQPQQAAKPLRRPLNATSGSAEDRIRDGWGIGILAPSLPEINHQKICVSRVKATAPPLAADVPHADAGSTQDRSDPAA
jgi:hypothetical protein